jgi:hypothetical protein
MALGTKKSGIMPVGNMISLLGTGGEKSCKGPCVEVKPKKRALRKSAMPTKKINFPGPSMLNYRFIT